MAILLNEAPHPQRVKIFHGPDEDFNLTIGVLFLALTFLGFVFNLFPKEGSPNQIVFFLIVQIIFLNSVHTGLTFFTLFRLPEFRSYLQSRSASIFLRSQYVWALLLLTMFLFTFVVRDGFTRFLFFQGASFFSATTMWFQVFLAIWGSYHIQSQFRGISMLYDRAAIAKLDNDPKTTQTIRAAQGREKLFHHFLTLTIVLGFLQKPLHFYLLPQLRLISLLGCGGIFISSLSTASLMGFGKSIYNLRNLVLSLTLYGYIFMYASMALHGLEYFFLSKKMLSASQEKNPRFRAKLLYAGLFLGILVFSTHIWAYYPDIFKATGIGSGWFFFAFVALDSTVQLHYFVDGIIFKFSKPEIRKSLGPLLF